MAINEAYFRVTPTTVENFLFPSGRFVRNFLTWLFFLFDFSEEYSDHPNEVVKNEELTYNGATSYGFGQVLFLMVSSVMISVLMPQLLR